MRAKTGSAGNQLVEYKDITDFNCPSPQQVRASDDKGAEDSFVYQKRETLDFKNLSATGKQRLRLRSHQIKPPVL